MNNFFYVIPLVFFSCGLLVIIALSIENKKAKKILFGLGFTVGSIFTIFFMGVAVPYMFLGSMFENAGGIILMLAIIFTVWMIISLFIKFKNQLIFWKNNTKDIYVRDVEVKYSPAILSYLMNNKIETKKDLPATLLNLCAKNILKIEKDNSGKINIIDLKNNLEVNKLEKDEKYAYEMLVSGVTNSKIVKWKNIVESEYAKYRFSKSNKRYLWKYIFAVYFLLIVGLIAYSAITGEDTITGDAGRIIATTIIATFIGAWEMIIFSVIKESINVIIKRKEKGEFKDIYTDKGAREYIRWKKFEKFINDFSLISEREHDSIVLWGKYLSYSIALGINKKCDKELFNKIEKEYLFNYNVFENMFSIDD